jgi:hypothetical protein
LFALRSRGLSEAGKIQRHHAKTSVGHRLKVLSPHRAVSDAGVKKDQRRAGANVIVREQHTPSIPARPESALGP